MYSDTMSLLLGCPACMLGPGPPNTRVTTQVCKHPENRFSLQTLIFGTEFVKRSFVKTWQILQDNDHSSFQDTNLLSCTTKLFGSLYQIILLTCQNFYLLVFVVCWKFYFPGSGVACWVRFIELVDTWEVV